MRPLNMSKRKLPRRELQWIGTFIDSLPFSRLPINHALLRRVFFLTETGANGKTKLDVAAVFAKIELAEVWSYAEYGDILHYSCNILRSTKSLHASYRILSKTPITRRTTPAFLKKEVAFLETLPKLFNITSFQPKDDTRISWFPAQLLVEAHLLNSRSFILHHNSTSFPSYCINCTQSCLWSRIHTHYTSAPLQLPDLLAQLFIFLGTSCRRLDQMPLDLEWATTNLLLWLLSSQITEAETMETLMT